DRMTLTLTEGAKEREYQLTENTQVLDAKGTTLKERLQGFKEGAEVFFKAVKQGDKDVIVGLKLAAAEPPKGDFPKVDTSALKPLTELGAKESQGSPGGLYPGGKNERPLAHNTAGLALAKEVGPVGADGKPAPDGKIVLLSIGMSNTGQASAGFQKALA